MPLNIKGTLLPAESNIGSGHNLLDVLYMCRIYSAEEKKKKKKKEKLGRDQGVYYFHSPTILLNAVSLYKIFTVVK